jgi:hypothetical protein
MANDEQQLKIFNSINDTLNITNTTLSNNDTNLQYRYEGPLTTEDGNSERNLKNDLNNSISFVSTSTENTRISISVYGNDVKLRSPLKIGKCYSFLYYKGLPIITLGPECKKINKIFYLKLKLILFIIYYILYISIKYYFIKLINFFIIFIIDYMSFLLMFIINLANFLFIIYIYPNIYYIFKYIGITIYLIQSISHIYTMLINPGIPNKNNYISDNVLQIIYANMKISGITFNNYRNCKICNILVNKEDNVIHCDDCDICIKGILFVYLFLFYFIFFNFYNKWIIIVFGLVNV